MPDGGAGTEVMQTMDWFEGDVVVNGVRLHYARAGRGTPVLLLHGVTDNGRCWGCTADALVHEHEIVLLDQRGHGRSEAPAGTCTPETLAADAAGVIRALGLAPTAVIGHALGALAALMLAAHYPGLVAHLVLEDPPLVPPEGGDRRLFSWLRGLQLLSRNELIEECREASPDWSPEECVSWAESKLQVDAHLLRPGILDISLDWERALQQVQCPTLILCGDTTRGAVLDDETAARAAALLQFGDIGYIVQSGHSVHRDNVAAFLAAVQPFLQSKTPAMSGVI